MVQADVVPIASVLVCPRLLVQVMRPVRYRHGLVRNTVQAGIAGKICAEFTRAAAGGQVLPDERQQCWIFGAGAVENRADEQKEQSA